MWLSIFLACVSVPEEEAMGAAALGKPQPHSAFPQGEPARFSSPFTPHFRKH